MLYSHKNSCTNLTSWKPFCLFSYHKCLKKNCQDLIVTCLKSYSDPRHKCSMSFNVLVKMASINTEKMTHIYHKYGYSELSHLNKLSRFVFQSDKWESWSHVRQSLLQFPGVTFKSSKVGSLLLLGLGCILLQLCLCRCLFFIAKQFLLSTRSSRWASRLGTRDTVQDNCKRNQKS